jgi:hypothetical protein
MRYRFLNSKLISVAAAIFVMSLVVTSLGAVKKPKASPKETAAGEPAVTPKPAVPDLEVITRLPEEEFGHGQVMDLMSHLTDDIGPRLTGSPNLKKANDWTRDQLSQWGLTNPQLEPWGTFGRGWAYQLCEVRMISPDFMQFLALPEAWTPGTNGPIRGEVVQVIASRSADLEKYRDKLAGKIVLFGEARTPEPRKGLVRALW